MGEWEVVSANQLVLMPRLKGHHSSKPPMCPLSLHPAQRLQQSPHRAKIRTYNSCLLSKLRQLPLLSCPLSWKPGVLQTC
jgi:hypothetical protein